ncbi:MAG: hypothetical protein U9R27_09735 [Campylobacterota bacterium]|nr:hypothetical protein [Campylobacterota bacterium]
MRRDLNIKILLASTLLLTSFSVADDTTEKLFDSKCATCHSKTRPTDMSKVVAPAIMGVMRHIKMSYPQKEKAVEFMVDYVMTPTKEKAICMPNKIDRFGLMPSQKGLLTKDELTEISNWLYDNYPPEGFRGMGQGRGMGNRY